MNKKMRSISFIKMCSLSFFLAAYFLFSPRDNISQVTQEWVKRHNSTGNVNDYGYCVTYDAAGNVYAGGSSNGDYITIKYSPEGNVIWQAVYAGPGNDADQVNDICVDASGNVYVTGSSYGTGSETDFATVKYDAGGNELWVQRYNGTNNDGDAGVSVAVDAAGNVYAGGWSSRSTGSADYAIIKYSPAGSQLWSRFYEGTGNGNDFMESMVIDAAGNLYATGRSRGSSSDDYATVKYSPAGTLLWSARYQGSSTDQAFALVVDDAANVYVTGQSNSGLNGYDYVTVKYNNAGIQQWLKRYNRTGSSTDRAVDIALGTNGNIYVTGSCTGSNTASTDIITVAYSNNGSDLWVKSYTGGLVGEDDNAGAICTDNTGNVYVAGSTTGSGTGFDISTIKYSSSGDVLWTSRYYITGNRDETAGNITANGSGNVYVVGTGLGLFTGNDIVTIKFSQPIGIEPISSEVPSNFELGQNYPNPFNPKTNIKIQISNGGLVNLKIYDISGKEVAVLVNENLNAGTYNIDFDASHLASGTYFYRMETGNVSQTRKMMLVK